MIDDSGRFKREISRYFLLILVLAFNACNQS